MPGHFRGEKRAYVCDARSIGVVYLESIAVGRSKTGGVERIDREIGEHDDGARERGKRETTITVGENERGTVVGDEKRVGAARLREDDADKAAVNRRRDVSAPLPHSRPDHRDFPTTRDNFIPATMNKMSLASPGYHVFFLPPSEPASNRKFLAEFFVRHP